MDYIKSALGQPQDGQNANVVDQQGQQPQSEQQGGLGGWLGNTVNGALGGGPNSEKNVSLRSEVSYRLMC
jgi:hypothetical protein